ncbi:MULTISPECIES: hypothetical protein [unclassified Streptomyces]|uniref:Integral membrane protein n=1 Tax=Streptomyces sp. 900105245 TaxID=3154379 RepID=A0ABV1U8J7_9ACTN|nr:hypothetical protein [Streptomyces sp. CB01883]OKJ80019.1 hypothetical protein AMK32_27395 [Streptomyces sp. CB01883]
MSDTTPRPEHHGYDYGQPVAPAPQGPADPYRSAGAGRERRRDGSGTRRTALVVHTVADVAAAFLGLWILLHLLEANHANVFVRFVQDVADALAWWSQDVFTMDTENLRVLLDYGLPAVVYLLAGHGIAARLRRF